MPSPLRQRYTRLYAAWCLAALSTTTVTTTAAEIPWNLKAVRADEAHAMGYTGQGVAVGVIDSGLDTQHPAFAGRIDPRSHDFTDPAATDATVTDGHGTHVAGVIAAGKGVGPMYGIAYDATLLDLRALDDSESDEDDYAPLPTAAALRYAADLKLKVINGSYGPPVLPSKRSTKGGYNHYHQVLPHQILIFNEDTNEVRYMAEFEAIKTAAAADVVMVFAAGNDTRFQPLASQHPSGGGLLPYIRPENHASGVYRFISNQTPDRNDPNTYRYLSPDDPRLAGLDFSALQGKLIAVVATDRDGEITDYSNRCGVAWQWCIAAPGGSVPYNSEKSVLSTTPTSRDTGGYDALSGSSIAAALVAGAVAVVRSAFPHLDARQTVELLLNAADNTGRFSDRDTYGRGMLNVGRAVKEPK